MGPPGSGKTTISKVLGKLLIMPVYDVDDDHLEVDWKTTVSDKLSQLGDEKFIEAEGCIY
jgi:shikimate kinase